MHLIDTHTHITHFKKDQIDGVLDRADKENVKKMITVTCEIGEFDTCLGVAKSHDNIWTTSGIHPTEIGEDFDSDMEKVRIVGQEEKVVAIGEIGLDYYHDKFPHDIQEQYFVGQINIAKELNKPAIIHCRGGKNPGQNEGAFIDTLNILEREGFGNAVMHCFSGNSLEAEKVMDLGLMISFTGILTYNGNEELREIAKNMPLDKIMLETDSPYLTVKGKRNGPGEPAYVNDIAKLIADLKGIPFDEVAKATTKNAERFFSI